MNFKIKKRVILAIIFTVVTIIAANKFWYSHLPLPLSMDIKGKNTCTIEIQINLKDSNDIMARKIRRDKKTLNLNENFKADFLIKNVRHPKRLKIVIYGLEKNVPLKISKIVFNNKDELNDLENFSAEEAEITVKNNELIIIPLSGTIYLTYEKTLKTKEPIKFDFCVFIIILVLSYLIFYKLSNYSASFKDINKKSRIEIIFLTIFFIFLFVPMSRINQDEISKQENRTLAKLKPLIYKNCIINFRFTKDFDDWFCDRFNLREFFISVYDTRWLLAKNWKTNSVLKGKDNWLFSNSIESTNSYTNENPFTENDLKIITSYLEEVNDYCNKHNKKFYFLIAPDKSKIYGEYYPDEIKAPKTQSRAEQLTEYLRKNSKINVIYPKSALIKNKGKDLLYWKQDTHWNNLGGYIGYCELMKEINKDYKDIAVFKPKSYTKETHIGDLNKTLPKILQKEDKTLYKTPSQENKDICVFPEYDKGIVNCFNKNEKINLIMYRDSFSRALIPYLSYSFKNSKFIWRYDISKTVIDEGDVIVLQVVERFLHELKEKKLQM